MTSSTTMPPLGAPDAVSAGTVAVVVLTHNRVHLLQKCVENVLAKASPATTEIVIWNNGSTDGTQAYLDSLDDPRLNVVHSVENVGQNGYARGFALTKADYLVELDDDVVDAPQHWDVTLREAYERLPEIGFLAADIQDDPHDLAAHYRYRVRPHEYAPLEVNGVALLAGPAGGACAMTARSLYDRVGGFRQSRKGVFWQEEPAYIEDIRALGFGAAVLRDLRVHHTGGAYYGATSPEKTAFWASYWRMRARRERAKRILVRVPGVRRLNSRYGWFVAP
jgi:GT2 family glycosyltransferase